MAAEIIPFDHKGGAGQALMPAHLAALFGGDGESNIGPRVTINQLSYRGKTFRLVLDGDEKPLMRKDEAGDMVPVQVVNVIILDQNKNRSRAFYEGEFEEGKNAAPKCYSGDGVKPDADVKEPCATTCQACPNSVKGSKITPQGKQVTACAPFKRIAIVPSAAVSVHPPLLLRLAQTSVWDKDNPNEAQGWYAYDQYIDMLRARGAKHTAAVETRVKFDVGTAYPKLLFSASRWLSPEEAAAAKVRLDNAADKDAIEKILNGGAADGVAGTAPAPAAAATPTPTPSADPAADAAAVAAAALAAQQAQQAAAAQAAQQAAAAAAAQQAAAQAAAEQAAAAQAAQAAAAAAAAQAAQRAALQAQLDALNAAPAAAAPATTAAATATAAADAFGGAPEPAATPVATATPAATAAATPGVEVMEGTPGGLKNLLDNWDA